LGALLVIPLIVALLAGECIQSALFGIAALGALLVGRWGARRRPATLELKEALVVTALAYPAFGLAGAVPFLAETSFLNAFFEATSGFTTTGLSVLDPETLPYSLAFFRAYAQWVGGAGIIVLSLAVLLRPGRAAFRLYASEFGEENLIGSVIATARVVLSVYIALTALGFLAYIAVGMGPWDALLHVLATISTGGFSPYNKSIGHFSSPFVPLAVTLFVLLGAISFPLYYRARREGLGQLLGDVQVRVLLLLAAIGTLVFWGFSGWRPSELIPGLFHTASALTTAGFSLSDAGAWPEGVRALTLGLMVLGGSAGSTAGGLKLLRLILLLKLAHRLVIRVLLPEEAKVPVKLHGIAVADRELELVAGFFALYVGWLGLSALLLVLAGFPLERALFESASALGTVGLSVGVTSPELAGWAKLVLIVDMWAGRLEILPVLVVLYPSTWRWRA
jgi:trk system potassium uptake protein TrkH